MEFKKKGSVSTGLPKTTHTRKARNGKTYERQAVGVWILQAVNHMIHNHLFVTHISQELSGNSTPSQSLNYYVVSCHKRYKAQHSTSEQLHVILSEWLHLPWPLISRSGITFPFHYWNHVRTDSTSPPLGTIVLAFLGGYDATTASLDTSGQEWYR